jgi:hypothetical protein
VLGTPPTAHSDGALSRYRIQTVDVDRILDTCAPIMYIFADWRGRCQCDGAGMLAGAVLSARVGGVVLLLIGAADELGLSGLVDASAGS